MKFLKNEKDKGRLSAEVFRQLWDRNCIEVDNLPAENLANAIDPVFARERFAGALTAEEYNFIRPAARLASRFLTAANYIDFWKALTAGRPIARTVRVDGKAVVEYYIRHPPPAAALQTRTLNMFQSIAPHIQWFNMDREWTDASSDHVAETFMDTDDRDCKRYRALNNNDTCGTCKYCVADAQGRCPICGYREYAHSWNCDQLRELHKSRGLRGYSKMKKAELIAALQTADNLVSTAPSQPRSRGVPVAQFHNIRIGLIPDIIEHIQNRDTDNWTRCEELRFQFALAATLAHELSHAFWYFAQKRCWSCFNDDPWYAQNETRHVNGPEIGNSWEYFAFGTRLPTGGRIRVDRTEGPPNVFSQCQWNYLCATEEAGWSKTDYDIITHDFILPVEYINSWFLESTWQSIAANGREQGRPSINNAVVLRELATKMHQDGSYGARTCSIERYTYRQLCDKRGLRGPNRAWVYGKDLNTARQAQDHRRTLRRERDARPRKTKKKVKRKS
jgi:hypothetical protein